MNWRDKFEDLTTGDTSDKTPTSVTSVTTLPRNRIVRPQGPESDAENSVVVGARGALNRAGVRSFLVNGVRHIGLWSDMDSAEIRAALRSLGHELLSVVYLDGAGVPLTYKARNVEGEPVPLAVLAAMEQQPTEPWKVRDQMLREMGWLASRGATTGPNGAARRKDPKGFSSAPSDRTAGGHSHLQDLFPCSEEKVVSPGDGGDEGNEEGDRHG
jgi:hypothetical protein